MHLESGAREKYKMELVSKYGKEEIDKKKSEFQEKMEEDGFQMVGGEADDFKPQKIDDGEWKPRKKKKDDTALQDFYKFQVKNNSLRGMNYFIFPMIYD